MVTRHVITHGHVLAQTRLGQRGRVNVGPNAVPRSAANIPIGDPNPKQAATCSVMKYEARLLSSATELGYGALLYSSATKLGY